ncbi:hypothetical protein LSTR_LSTR005389 [Laodelphax striatellus]|uniref:Uncharacterized protein n=1 Tax=Laodelphax striatellus TaxID=195883 RepID=A0A482WRS0_LAOST|nr:hypothetical protein LSTR_LSTR005389 [Laodelphax striatellus]
MTQLKELYKVTSCHSAFYTGGDIEWTDDGENLLCQCGGKVRVLDINEGNVLSTICEEENTGLDEEIEEDTILTFTLSNDNSSIVVAHKSGLLKSWDWKEKKLLKTWRSLHKVPISKLACYKNNSLLATGATDASIRIWDLDHHACRRSLPSSGMTGVISVLVFLDELVFAAADDAAIRSWEFASGTLKSTYSGHFSKVTSLEILPDKKRMISCGRDKVVIVWDIPGGRAFRTIAVYETLESLVLLPNSLSLPDKAKQPQKGTFVACAGEKGVLRVWNTDPAGELYVSDSFLSTSSNSDAQGIKKLMICPSKNSLAIVSSFVYHTKAILFYNSSHLSQTICHLFQQWQSIRSSFDAAMSREIRVQ